MTMQATAALNLNTQASSKVADSTTKSTTPTVTAEGEGGFRKSLSKVVEAESSEKSEGSGKAGQRQSTSESTKTDASVKKASGKDSVQSEKASSDSLLGSLFADEDGDTSVDDATKVTGEAATGETKGAASAASKDVDDNMQEASELLKRLDESNAALQSDTDQSSSAASNKQAIGQNGKSQAGTSDSVEQPAVDKSHALDRSVAGVQGSAEQASSDGNLTKAQNMAPENGSKAASNTKLEADVLSSDAVDGEPSANQSSNSLKQAGVDENAHSKADQTEAKLAHQSAEISSEASQTSVNTKTTGEPSADSVADSLANDPQKSGMTGDRESSSDDFESSKQNDSSGVYGQSSKDDTIDWEQSVTSGASVSQAQPNQAEAVKGATTPASVGQTNGLNASSTTAVAAGAVGQQPATSVAWNTAGNTQMAQSASANSVTTAAAPAGSKHQAALAAAGMQAVRNQKSDPNQTEPTTVVESMNTTQNQNSLSGLQRLEQAQQAQAPVQVKSELATEQMAERVQMMMSKNLKNIDIRLDPPELGRMQIRMNMNGDLASVQITVSNPAARDLIEQTMPRLREMLAQNGVALAEASVQQQSSRGGQAQQGGQSSGGQSSGSDGNNFDGGADDEPAIQVSTPSPEQGISYFA